MEIRPATLKQVLAAKGEDYIEIEDDVQNVANDLAAIDPHFRLRYSEAGEYFVVYWHDPDDTDYLVTTAQEIDQRIVKRVAEIYHRTLNEPGYSYANEIEKQEKKAEAEANYVRREKLGPIAERLAFAMRKELGYNDGHIFVPGASNGDA